ncbi:hypothetical protein COLO4_26635 [Corchorus olitorius]|uniref:Uncharacterized protein n=1 Tax=Corchorus olitorius TaxID=93759 RepID=A0A1R3HV79_9ROSI|nr:hypothetical protein COLO4_26635 [Corchorus olitorius]
MSLFPTPQPNHLSHYFNPTPNNSNLSGKAAHFSTQQQPQQSQLQFPQQQQPFQQQ